MDRLVVGSTSRGAGKTSLLVGIARALGGKLVYRKPFGDRLVYRRKVARDHDAALLAALFGLSDRPEEATLGFEHVKLRYMYDDETRAARLREMVPQGDSGPLLVEAGADLACGASVGLDAVSLARDLAARLLLVAAGSENQVMDELAFVRRRLDLRGVELAGVVANKMRDVENFRTAHAPELERLGLPVLGVVPFHEPLTRPSVAFVVERLFGKVLTGDEALGRPVQNVFIGAMSADVAFRSPLFRHPGKLILTSGDRSDMVLAALEGDTACVVLTNNVMPPANIVARAAERGVPLVLVSQDTFQAAKQVDDLEPLLTAGEAEKVELLGRTVAEAVRLDRLLPGTPLPRAAGGA